jgi:hypothetical protein
MHLESCDSLGQSLNGSRATSLHKSSIKSSDNYIHVFHLCGLTIFSFLEFQYAFFGKEKDYHLFDLTTLVDGSDNLNGGHSLKNQLKSPL